jgi:hypothetical protein
MKYSVHDTKYIFSKNGKLHREGCLYFFYFYHFNLTKPNTQ